MLAVCFHEVMLPFFSPTSHLVYHRRAEAIGEWMKLLRTNNNQRNKTKQTRIYWITEILVNWRDVSWCAWRGVVSTRFEVALLLLLLLLFLLVFFTFHFGAFVFLLLLLILSFSPFRVVTLKVYLFYKEWKQNLKPNQ